MYIAFILLYFKGFPHLNIKNWKTWIKVNYRYDENEKDLQKLTDNYKTEAWICESGCCCVTHKPLFMNLFGELQVLFQTELKVFLTVVFLLANCNLHHLTLIPHVHAWLSHFRGRWSMKQWQNCIRHTCRQLNAAC